MITHRWFWLGALSVIAAAAACSSDSKEKQSASNATVVTIADAGPVKDAGPVAEAKWPHLGCDPLVPSYCMFPWPSNVYTVADDTTPTGLRLALKKDAMLLSTGGVRTSVDELNKSDGFSPGGPLMAHFPGVTMEGLPDIDHIEDSLTPSAPVIVVTEDGERAPYFVEIDATGSSDNTRSFMIRPATRLKDATRYIVAIRGLRSAKGALMASPAFAALRDDKAYDKEPSVEQRRALYADIFSRLSAKGVDKENLLLAWDFTTASRENNTGNVLHMRDAELLNFRKAGPDVKVTKVETDFDPRIAFRLEGHITVPLYLTDTSSNGRLVFDENGHPKVNPDRPTAEVSFLMMIPKSASKKNPAALLQYGHGLLGEPGEIEAEHLLEIASKYNYALFGIHQWGMASDDGHLANDATSIGFGLQSGDLEQLVPMYDRLQQSQLNHLLAMRGMINELAQKGDYADVIDENQRYYYGASQGGIFGGTYMALSTDVTRGVLDVTGQPYHLLLPRSVNFDQFFAIMRDQWPDERNQMLGLALVQMLWDRSEPNGYTKYIQENMLPGTPRHTVMMRVAIGDHQVSTRGGQVMARTVGAKHLDTGVRKVFGLELAKTIEDESGYLEVDFGLPPEPVCDLPIDVCEDPHRLGRNLPAALGQLDVFLRNGLITNICEGGVCSYPEFSGCTPEDATPTCPD